MKRVIDVSETLYNTCKRLVSEGDPRPSESCIANSEPYELNSTNREVLKEKITKGMRYAPIDDNAKKIILTAILSDIDDVFPDRPQDVSETLYNTCKRLIEECCGSCYLCDVGDCEADMQKGSEEK